MPDGQDNANKMGPLQPPAATSCSVADDSQAKLLEHIPHIASDPLWTQMSVLVPPQPLPKAVVHKWEYAALRPALVRAGHLVPEEQAERRVLMLTNPGLRPGFTTDTLYAGLQLVKPGETAPAHRHTAFAIRFIIEGHGGFTAVQGKRIKMQRGDFILTPSWTWHDHGNDGMAEPMIWLDGLDLPQFQHFPVHFAQHYSEPRYPAEDAPVSPILFRWSAMQARLDGSGSYSQARYTSQKPGEEGKEVSPRIGAQCERIDAGCEFPRRRENSSCVYHIVDGSGSSIIGQQTLTWVKGDTFSIPSWMPYTHQADQKSYMFRFDDRPMLQLLGFYRTEAEDFFNLP